MIRGKKNKALKNIMKRKINVMRLNMLKKKRETYLYHLIFTAAGLATASHVNLTLSSSIILSVLTFRVISGGSGKKIQKTFISITDLSSLMAHSVTNEILF